MRGPVQLAAMSSTHNISTVLTGTISLRWRRLLDMALTTTWMAP